MFKKRIGPDPHMDGTVMTSGKVGCPDIWELESGDFAVIGIDKSTQLKPHLPKGASCGPDERIVVIGRSVLIGARQDIPAE